MLIFDNSFSIHFLDHSIFLPSCCIPATYAEFYTYVPVSNDNRYRAVHAEFRFRVQACEGAHIALLMGAEEGGYFTSYEVVIGGQGNTLTYIIR